MPQGNLAATVKTLQAFVPAKDFAVSQRFYRDLGCDVELLNKDLAEVKLGSQSFLLQNYFVEDWANNFMLYLDVTDIEAWWQHIVSLDLPARYGVPAPRPPVLEPWGSHVFRVVDPAGVLWHIAANAAG